MKEMLISPLSWKERSPFLGFYFFYVLELSVTQRTRKFTSMLCRIFSTVRLFVHPESELTVLTLFRFSNQPVSSKGPNVYLLIFCLASRCMFISSLDVWTQSRKQQNIFKNIVKKEVIDFLGTIFQCLLKKGMQYNAKCNGFMISNF